MQLLTPGIINLVYDIFEFIHRLLKAILDTIKSLLVFINDLPPKTTATLEKPKRHFVIWHSCIFQAFFFSFFFFLLSPDEVVAALLACAVGQLNLETGIKKGFHRNQFLLCFPAHDFPSFAGIVLPTAVRDEHHCFHLRQRS